MTSRYLRIAQLVGIVLLGVINAHIVWRRHATQNLPSKTYSWIGHDFPERLPLDHDLDSVFMNTEESMFYGLGKEWEDSWTSLLASSGGYYRLGPRNRTFAVTMFHELHCLETFNYGFSANILLDHVVHCLTYLRHGALCSADLTLEPGDFAKRNFSRDHVGATHECRDWSHLYDTIEKNWDAWRSASKTPAPGADSGS